jgi:NADH-quinone oxidoreductase subunit C
MSAEPKGQLPESFKNIRAWRENRGNYAQNGSHLEFSIDSDALLPAAAILNDEAYFLEDITGVDVTEGIMLIYHFDRYGDCGRVTLRMIIPHESKKAPSITSIHSGADWHERECFDFYGVIFEHHPNLKPLLLPDDLGVHPLLKEKGRKSLMSLLPLDQVVDSRI